MSNLEKVVVLDFDGTLFDDFFIQDRKIINEVFNGSKIVLFIDLIARKFNALGIIKNNNLLLRLRLFVYALFAGKSFKHSLMEYRRLYRFYAKKAIKRNSDLLAKLKSKGYKIIILSNNVYTSELEIDYELIVNTNKYVEFEELFNEYGNGMKCVIGDNFFDDICNAAKFGIKTIYIGKSPLVRKSSKISYRVNNLEEAINSVLKIL